MFAVMVTGKLPAAVVVPANRAEPSRLSVKVTPLGSAPVSLSAGAGIPVVVTTKELAVPFENEADAAEVIAGPWMRCKVKDWEAGLPTPLVAVIVKE